MKRNYYPGIGQLKIYMSNSKKTTETVWCNRCEIQGYLIFAKNNNAIDSEGAKIKFIEWNGRRLQMNEWESILLN
jgi:hypothetical protein